jgi:hypothetical protein
MRVLRLLMIALPNWKSLHHGTIALTLLSLMGGLSLSPKPAEAQVITFCHLTPEAIAQKEALRQAAIKGSKEAQKKYKILIQEHAERLEKCRKQTWPRDLAIWIRLYPCDIRKGELDGVMDRIVNRGYNQVYIEAFFNGQVLLPVAENRTPWPSVLRAPGYEKTDLLAQALQKARERGLGAYAWMFSMNFGYTYAQRSERQWALARNGYGQTSLTAGISRGLSTEIGAFNPDEAFIDPYNPQAKQDYYQMAQAIAQRKPDGMLFDYIRYPRGTGTASVANQVKDLWIYGSAAQQALYKRAGNEKGLELIRRYLSKGNITAGDIVAVDRRYPNEGEPLWQGRNPPVKMAKMSPEQRQAVLQWELWQLTVAHALQGVLDFLSLAASTAQQQSIPAGAVFFPDGNQSVGRGFDSRLQPWDRFPKSLEWHPMSYGVCGNTSCILSLVKRVLNQAPAGVEVKPVIAGIWQRSISNRPPLEVQMQSLRQMAPQIKSVSHFAYSWQEPQSDRDRKFCKL